MLTTGRTIVCTIHQPSIDTFEAFDENNEGDADSDFEYEGSANINEASIRGVPKVTHQYNLRTRSSNDEKGKGLADSDNHEQEEDEVHSQITEKIVSTNEGDGDSELPNEGNSEVDEVGRRGVPGVNHQYNLRSRSCNNEKGKGVPASSAADEQGEHAVCSQISEKKKNEGDGDLELKTEGNTDINEVSRWVPRHHYNLRSRQSENKKGKGLVVSSTAEVRKVFEEQEEHAVRCQISENNKSRSRKCRKSRAKESEVGGSVPCEDAQYESVDEYKGKADEPPVVYEIPLRPPPARSDQMAIVKLSSLIAIDPRPFDPDTYVEDEYYVTDASGCKRAVPSTNIIRWKKVKNSDGTTSVQSNARFVMWEDDSIELFIGNKAFIISEQEAKDIQLHLFLRVGEDIYQCQGKITKTLKLFPTPISSNSHREAGHVNSRLGKPCKVRECVTEVDPERKLPKEKEEGRNMKGNKESKEKKKHVIDMHTPKGQRSSRNID